MATPARVRRGRWPVLFAVVQPYVNGHVGPSVADMIYVFVRSAWCATITIDSPLSSFLASSLPPITALGLSCLSVSLSFSPGLSSALSLFLALLRRSLASSTNQGAGTGAGTGTDTAETSIWPFFFSFSNPKSHIKSTCIFSR